MAINLRVEGLKDQFHAVQSLLGEIPGEALVQKTPIEGYGTIGEQFRHLINYAEVLLRDCAECRIDFTNRDRNPLLETQKEFINARIIQLLNKMDILSEQDLTRDVESVFVPVVGQEPVIDVAQLGFMIDYVTDHSYHHVSTIKILAHIQGIDIKSSSGVSPATMQYQAN